MTSAGFAKVRKPCPTTYAMAGRHRVHGEEPTLVECRQEELDRLWREYEQAPQPSAKRSAQKERERQKKRRLVTLLRLNGEWTQDLKYNEDDYDTDTLEAYPPSLH
jgi:hypothetical protein